MEKIENINKPTLDELANKYLTDKGSLYPGVSKHGYAKYYDNLLSKWRDKKIRMLEVGICMESTEGGHSIYMWDDYFSNVSIFTFDIVDMSNHPSITNRDNIFFYRGDQSNRSDLVSMYKHFGSLDFDFILEDGSHIHEHQIISLAHLFKYIKSGGYYILEDVSIPGNSVCCIRNDETYEIIDNFIKTGEFNSIHTTSSEKKYLEKNIKSVDMHIDMQNAYVTIIFQKK